MRFLHLQCLQDAPDKAVEIAAISSAMGVDPSALDVVRPFEEDVPIARLEGASGMTIGGSALSVFYAIPRYRAFEGLLHRARASHIPIFGICFGAQALADAFGGKVIRDLKRAEYGTIDVACDEAAAKGDSLFARAPARFAAQAWHRDRIVRLPVDARPLAWSPDGALQAFCLPDESVWGVQFHPERDQETFQRLLETRADPPGRAVADIRASLRPSPEAAALLARFARLCASRP